VARESAGLLLFRRGATGVEVLLVHPGGPFWKSKDAGVWSVPKGEPSPGEAPLDAARREFVEETGFAAPADPSRFLALGAVRQRGGKTVTAWAFEGDCDPAALRSGTFEMEWPPRSGRKATFPEVDRAAFYAPIEARRALHPDQVPFLDRLEGLLGRPEAPA
jgi:predicted NUDIX family NTP pyrophosphohydrolase